MKRRRKRNPSSRETVEAAIGMGIVGVTLGGLSSVVAGQRDKFPRMMIGALTGGVLGAGLGAVLARSEARSKNPSPNPAAIGSALLAGTAVAIVPPIVALEIMGRNRPLPAAHGHLGRRAFDVVLERDRWAWSAGSSAGTERTRRAAIAAAIIELTPRCGANDHIQVDLIRPTQTLHVAPQLAGGWTWTSGKRSGTSSTRRGALVEGLAVLREFADPS